MASGRYGPVLRQVGRLLSGGAVASLGTARLLERFALERDETAFEVLVNQHGPMVLGTCRRMLSDPDDIEDAFQATFLVLARRAGSIQDADRLGPWLHGVARRVASRSRALSARRNALEKTSIDETTAQAADALEASELRAALDEELASLPDKYRAPLVLCYLEGLTHDEAAQQLRWPVGTVRSRLAGGRDRLRARLTRRGLAPTSAVPAILARASVPPALLTTTVRVATSTGSIPSHVAILAKGALTAMIWSKLKVIGALGLMTTLTVGGAGIAAQKQGEGGKGQVPETTVAPRVSIGLTDKERLEKEIADQQAKLEMIRLRVELAETEWKKLVAGGDDADSVVLKKIQELTDERSSLKKDDEATRRRIESLKYGLVQLAALNGQARVDPVEKERIEKEIEEHKQRLAALNDRLAGMESNRKDNAPFKGFDANATLQRYKLLRTEILNTENKIIELTLSLVLTGTSNDQPKPLETQVGVMRKDLEAAIARIKNLEKELADERAKAQRVVGPVVQDFVAEKPKPTPVGTPGEKPATTKAEDPPAPAPLVKQLGADYVLVIPEKRDRATILKTQTGGLATLRFSEGVTEIVPIASSGLLTFVLKGPKVQQIAAFNYLDGKWYSQDLKEPTTEASPVTGPQEVTYVIGRFVYVYTNQAKKWAVLELKQAPRGVSQVNSGKMIVQEGDIVHVYNAETGEWTHNDTNAPDTEAPGPKAPNANPGPGTKPAPTGPRTGTKPPEPEPITFTIQGDPTLFMVVSASRDRVTMINSQTKKRETFRLPEPATEITPIVGPGRVHLMIKAPKITRVGYYDTQTAKWFEHDLKEPATDAQMIIGPQSVKGDGFIKAGLIAFHLKGAQFTKLEVFDASAGGWTTQELREPVKGEIGAVVAMNCVSYRSGRFLYIYSAIASKWSVLELKREDAGMGGVGGGGMFPTSPDAKGKLIIADGEVIHIYDAKTGEWTQIDTRDDK